MKTYPLLQAQVLIFLECQAYPNSMQYNIPLYVELGFNESPTALVAAWKRLIHSFAVFRTHIVMDQNGNPRQFPDDDMPVEIPVRSMTNEDVNSYISHDFVRPFDILSGEPLFRIEFIKTEEKLIMLMDFHHMIIDGFGLSSLLRNELKAALEVRQKAVDYSYFNIAEEEKNYFVSQSYQKSREYFVKQLEGLTATSFSLVSSAEGRLVTNMEYIYKNSCDKWCAEHGVAAHTLFQTAFALALGKMTGTNQPIYGTIFHSRINRVMIREKVGMFANNLIIKTNLVPRRSVMETLQMVAENIETAYKMGRYPYTHLQRETGIQLKVSYNFRPFQHYLNLGNKRYLVSAIHRSIVHSDIDIHIDVINDQYVIVAESSDAVNSPETVKMFAENIQHAVLDMMNHPETSIQDIPIRFKNGV